MKFNSPPQKVLHQNGDEIPSFIDQNHQNIDLITVDSFGVEWTKFDMFSDTEIEKIGNDYFDIVPWETLGHSIEALDVGCGTGRWAYYVSKKVSQIEAIDPSAAAWSAVKLLKDKDNVRISIADVDRIPFDDHSFDFVYSLGVLHHIPDTALALKKCVRKVKKGGYFLVYLYYNLENRGLVYKSVFYMSDLLRKMVSKLPASLKKNVCDVLALMLYMPFISVSWLIEKVGFKKFSNKIPLSYYKKTTWNIIRNDALDRFGTPLEQRFTKEKIESMMHHAGLENIIFSNRQPYWHAIGRKK